ncbi:transmembrane protein, putative (macronuclear) [Tetrahymena thermophila SB210]|uniref:Transmembrane protein, putative n=1 Tax=Tetrahymena thermophila (strain SB210) TaxID=312017 RepID=Q24GG0_TETTS|nr:transmembrane protein, putative [Tetrahymena thermophila SB210]EAS06911.1 transmembrane protein, putative [Tetrahymena thermophila SB210]|eukprot:XP_001027153.1 transmembrane protein, putative [Tetrahymena thermophila SB210]
MINNHNLGNQDLNSPKEFDFGFQGKFQTQSIYGTQQTLNRQATQPKKTQFAQENQYQNENIPPEDYNTDQQLKLIPNSPLLTSPRPFQELHQNLIYQNKQQNGQMQTNIGDLNYQNYGQTRNGNIYEAKSQENNDKTYQNQRLFSYECIDNDMFQSQNRILTPHNFSQDNNRFQQYFGRMDQSNNQKDLSNKNSQKQMNTNHIQNKDINLQEQENPELFSYRNDINQEEQKILNARLTNSMIQQNEIQVSASQQMNNQKNENEKANIERSQSSLNRKKINNYENQYYNIIMTKYNICISVLVVFLNTFTFGMFWALFYFEFQSAQYLTGIQQSNNFFFIVSSMGHTDYQDFFIYYRQIIDTVEYFILLIALFSNPRKCLEIFKLFFFYANFVITVFCFARMEKLLYYSDSLQLKSAIEKYNQCQMSNEGAFKDSFSNYYFILKIYIYAIPVSVVLQLICFVYYQPNQENLLNQQLQQIIKQQNSKQPKNQSQNNLNQNNIQQNKDVQNQEKAQNQESVNVQNQPFILPSMLNSTVQVRDGNVQLNISPTYKEKAPTQQNQVLE